MRVGTRAIVKRLPRAASSSSAALTKLVPHRHFSEDPLPRNAANYESLTPISLVQRAANVFPHRTAVVQLTAEGSERSWTYQDAFGRCKRLASALAGRGVGKNDVVAVILPNVPEMWESHQGVPMCGGILNSINTRLDAETIAYILEHGGAKVLMVDYEAREVAQEALRLLRESGVADDALPLVVDVNEGREDMAGGIGALTYEELLAEGDPGYAWEVPADEFDAIALNYTSGTTGKPKGVMLHHRGAWMTAMSNTFVWDMGHYPVYLWTLPMFHCNGWAFPWTVPALGGTHVCLRDVDAANIYQNIAKYEVTHFCGAPIILQMLINAPEEEREAWSHQVKMMTAASPPPPSVLQAAEAMGISVTHVYGLTEVYGPATVCVWQPEWDGEGAAQQAALNSRQGVSYPTVEGLMVGDPETLEPVPWDGETLGEVFMRGNGVMKGYHANPEATAEAFEGGWFHTGDLGVVDPDGYVALKDRSKDIIISGGENISTIEVETVLYRHAAVGECAVVGRPDEKWGETPCAFVTLADPSAASEELKKEIIEFTRGEMAHFKCPKTVVFGDLPKTNTGKIQKFELREAASKLED